MTAEALSPPRQLLTSSRLRCARDCARKHQLMYVEGWRPVRTADALRFGSLIHRGLEALWRAIQAWQTDSTIISDDFLSPALAALAVEADPFDRVRAEEMLRAYAAAYANDMTQYTVLAVEARFQAPLLNPETFAPSRTWLLAGKVDVIVRRKADSRVLVIEHKVSSDDISNDASDYWLKLTFDQQISGYVLGAESLGLPTDEILYDVLGKPAQRPAKATPVESRKYTVGGVLYANQREYDERPEEYRLRVRAAIAENPARFLQRKSIPRTEDSIREYMFDAWQSAATMRESARLGRAPRNPDSCHRMGVCPFWLACSTGAKPADFPSDYIKITDMNPELAG